eukprot:SAG11_NODE_27336_length_333_cov_25.854701_1_plen_46_part_01
MGELEPPKLLLLSLVFMGLMTMVSLLSSVSDMIFPNHGVLVSECLP